MKDHTKNLEKFRSGEVLRAERLNEAYATLISIAKAAGLDLVRRHIWTTGSILTAQSLNDLLRDIETVTKHLGLGRVTWTFGHFKNGVVLKAEYLNEVIDMINVCERKLQH